MKQVNLLNQEEVTAYKNFLMDYCKQVDPSGIQIHYVNLESAYSFILTDCTYEGNTREETLEHYVDYLLTKIKKDKNVNLLVWRTSLDELEDQLETDLKEPDAPGSKYLEKVLDLAEKVINQKN